MFLHVFTSEQINSNKLPENIKWLYRFHLVENINSGVFLSQKSHLIILCFKGGCLFRDLDGKLNFRIKEFWFNCHLCNYILSNTIS